MTPVTSETRPTIGVLLARYLTSSSHYSKEKGFPRPGAFLPTPKGETSVFQIDGLDEEAIWGIAEQYVAPELPQNRRVHGRADVPTASVESLGLRVAPDNTPPRHANIVGWPAEKDEQLSLAQELVKQAYEDKKLGSLRLL